MASSIQDDLKSIELAAIEQLKTLKDEQDLLDSRLKAMDEMRTSVADEVFIRVRSDYSARRSELEQRAQPLKAQAREQFAKLRRALTQLEAELRGSELDKQETEFRHKLGEYDAKEYDKRVRAIEAARGEKGTWLKQAEELKARFLAAFHSAVELEEALPTAPPPDSAGAATPVPGATRKFKALSGDDLVRAEADTNEIPAVPAPSPGATQVMAAVDMELPSAKSSDATMMFRAARLVPQNPEAGKASYNLALKATSIGGEAGNDVRVAGPGVDPKHARITVSMAGFTVVDLNSKHGTRVNAEKVREKLLRDEDVIQIGAARFVFREGQA